MNSLDGEGGNSGLLSFLHCEVNEQVAFFALVIIFEVRSHLSVQKTVGLIKGLHGLRIGIDQTTTESARRAKGPAKNLQPALQQFGVEILVARNLDADKFVFVAPLHGISNRFLLA